MFPEEDPWQPRINCEMAQDLEQFIRSHGGDTFISKILFASNGLAAVKGMRSIRKWSLETFNNENTIKFIAMATPDDIAANAEYIKLADEYVEVPSGPNYQNYANVDLIVNLARKYHVQVTFIYYLM